LVLLKRLQLGSGLDFRLLNFQILLLRKFLRISLSLNIDLLLLRIHLLTQLNLLFLLSLLLDLSQLFVHLFLLPFN